MSRTSYKFDEVEREFFILQNLLGRLSNAFGALATALRREREGVTTGGTRGRAPNSSAALVKSDKGVDPDPPVPSEPYEVFE